MMNIQYDAVVTTSVAKQIAEQLRDAILNGELQADTRLPTEHELAERYQVSRPTIREALKRLAAQNLIRSRRGPSGGTFVKRPNAEEMRENLITTSTLLVSMGAFELQDIAQARHQLERVCCQLAVQHRQDNHLQAMQAEIVQQQAEINDAEFCASDVRFHRSLVDAAGNPVLSFMMSTLIEALQPVANMLIFRFRDRQQVLEQHQQLYTALLDRNEAAAIAALDAQMEILSQQYQQAQLLREQRNREQEAATQV